MTQQHPPPLHHALVTCYDSVVDEPQLSYQGSTLMDDLFDYFNLTLPRQQVM
jgi:hypothetical protein